MKKRLALAVCAGLTTLLAGAANAQASLEVKDITTADAAAKLLQPIDDAGNTALSDTLAENGIDTGETQTFVESGSLLVGDPDNGSFDPFMAEGGPIRVLNCSPAAFTVSTYNAIDTVYWVPFQTVTVNVGEVADVKCASETCSLKVDAHGPYTSKAGPQVWTRGDLYGTNNLSIGRGCSVYE